MIHLNQDLVDLVPAHLSQRGLFSVAMGPGLWLIGLIINLVQIALCFLFIR